MEKRASTPLGMFYQERDTEVKSNPSALFGIIACSILVFAFGKVYGDPGEGPAKISKSDVRNGDQLLREGSVGSGLFNLEKGRLRGDLTVFKYLKGYYIEDAEQMFFTSTGEQIKGNSFKL